MLDGYPPIRGLRLRSPRGMEVAGDPARPNYVMPRSVLDARLVEAATAAGAELRRASVRRLEQHDGLVMVDGELAARVVSAPTGPTRPSGGCSGSPPTRTGPWPSPSAATRRPRPAAPSS